VSINENKDDTATLKFTYEFNELGKFKEDNLRKDKYFEKHVGLILNTLLLEAENCGLSTKKT
jgi:hypothetical protein